MAKTKLSKGGNSPRKVIEYNGIKFDSELEVTWYKKLIPMFPDLERAKKIVIVNGFHCKENGVTKLQRDMTYTPDFVFELKQGTTTFLSKNFNYLLPGLYYVEVKSSFTAKKTDYGMRKKLFLRTLKKGVFFLEILQLNTKEYQATLYEGMEELW